MTRKLTLYSPAPMSTRLHELNEEFGALLRANGLDNEVVALALPESINHVSKQVAEDRAFTLPIVTPVDLVPAIHQTGPDWHGFHQPNPNLRLLASLYDVAFGVTAVGGLVKQPDHLRGRTVYAPFRPSSVRLLTEILLDIGWELGGEAEIEDSTPLDLGPAVGRGVLKATSWNIVTLEGENSVQNARLRNAQFLPIDDECLARINGSAHFQIDRCEFDDTQLISFRQGLAVWDNTPSEISEAILEILTAQKNGPFFNDVQSFANWPGLDEGYYSPALRQALAE